MLACAGLEEGVPSGEAGTPVDLLSPARQSVIVESGTGALQALTGAEISSLMDGNSLVGAYTGSNDTACEYHDPSGTIHGFYREAYTARWRVSGDTICYTYDSGQETCQWMVVTAQGLVSNYTTPDGALLTTSQVLRGNTCQ